MVAAFADGEAHFGRSDNFQQRRFGEIFFVMQLDAFGEQLSSPFRQRAFQRHQIGFSQWWRGEVMRCDHWPSSVISTSPVVSISSRPAACSLCATGSSRK